jgi:hypothetical protein
MPLFRVDPCLTLTASGSSFRISQPGRSIMSSLLTKTFVSPLAGLSVIYVISIENIPADFSLSFPNSFALFVLFLVPFTKKSAS